MTPTAPTRDEFLKHVAGHEIIIVLDRGLHRHITLKLPDSYNRHFHLVTWPGYLAFSGDMGAFTFARTPDMFGFFRGEGNIDRGYWAEKLVAIDRSGAREFSPDLYTAALLADFEAWEFDDEAQKIEARKALDRSAAALHPDSLEQAVTRAMDYTCPVTEQRFRDFYDHNLKTYTYGFTWCCFALQWAIAKYDAEKALIARGLTDAEQLAQGSRCSCRGSDDLCPCQNLPDPQTIAERKKAVPA